LRFGKNIHNRSLPAFANCRCIERARQDRLQLNAGAANDRFWFIGRSCEPADVVAALEPFLQPQTRFRAQNFKGVIGNVAHVLETSAHDARR